MQTTLMQFKCACGFEEPIGVDISVGIIIRGSISMVCPACGSIIHVEDVTMISAVKSGRKYPNAWTAP